MIIVVMGVSGAGKSTLGRALAGRLGWEFIEGDDFHSKKNVEKMRMGRPLNDHDRRPWLNRLHKVITYYAGHSLNLVLACSALKKDYRDVLGLGLTHMHFICLHGEPESIQKRLKTRPQHFMVPELLESQLAALEVPEDALLIPVHLSTEEQVTQVRKSLDI